ncbi:MAG: V-type ATP synthase subunit E [Acutalibacteraceae bacterium]
MPDTVSKTDNFLKAIEKYAEEQRTKIQSEAEDFKEKELNKAEEEGLREAYVLIQKKMSDINTKIASELSKAESASRKEIFIKRQEISEKVFEKAKQKLLDYTKTAKYSDMLQKSTKEISSRLNADDVVLLVKEDDMKFEKELKAAFGRNCEVKSSNEIEIGGVMGMSHKMGLLADETLDTKLSEQHEWFYENSGLCVTE